MDDKLTPFSLKFGMGSRTCIGKNISLMEISKVVPQLVRHFEFVPENGTPEWRTENVWFVKPKDFKCRIRLHSISAIG
jgi:cytochrome P450